MIKLSHCTFQNLYSTGNLLLLPLNSPEKGSKLQQLAEFKAMVVETSQMPHIMLHCCKIDLQHQSMENRLGDIVRLCKAGARMLPAWCQVW